MADELFHDSEPAICSAIVETTGQNVTLKNTTAGAWWATERVDSPEQTEEKYLDAAALYGDKFSWQR